MKARPRTNWKTCHLVAWALLPLNMVACESPLRPGADQGRDLYSESLMQRIVMENGAAGLPSSTYAGGVVEYTRVDESGPGAANPIETLATQPSIRNALQLGRSAAQLQTEEPVKDLSLQEAIARAARNSLAIKVEAYNPGIRETQIIEALASFDPVIFGQSQWQNTDTPQISPSYSNGVTWQNQLGIRRVLPTGGQVQASLGTTYRDIATPAGSLPLANKSIHMANINLQLTQPLLRGFGSDVTQANIYLAQRDLRVSLAQFKGQVITTVAEVEEAYYGLLLAKINVDIQSRLVVASQETYNTILQRGFDVTKASRGQAAAALASRQADFRRAQRDYRNASDRLKSLLNDPEFSIHTNLLINPTDRPITDPVAYNAQDCIETALRQRPEMQQARLQVERANIVITVARNDLLPRLDLTAGMQTGGLDDGLDGAFSATVNPMNAIDWSAGIRMEFALGNREKLAVEQRRLLERRQALDNMVNIAQTIVQDVKLQLRDVLFAYEEIQDRERARTGAAMEFEGIIEIQEIRTLSPEFLQLKLDSQARLANAEQGVIQAVLNYNLAIMRLERAKGTLLEFNRISLDRPPEAPRETQIGHPWFWTSTPVLK